MRLKRFPCQLQHHQITGSCLPNRRKRNTRIESDEPSFMSDRKSKQVDVGELPRAVDSGRVDRIWVQQTYVVRPKVVDFVLTGIRKTFHDGLDRQCVGIAGIGHYATACDV
jgi:hypothetical protein